MLKTQTLVRAAALTLFLGLTVVHANGLPVGDYAALLTSEYSEVPEPSSVVLVAGVLLVLLSLVRRKSRQ